MSIEGIAENILADLIFIFLITIIGWIWVSVSRRRKLHRFFSVQHSKRVVIYLSNLRVLTFGAIGISGKKMSYQGSAIAYGEMQAALQLRKLFSFVIPAIEDAAEILKRILVADVSVEIIISPLSMKELEARGSHITLGSSAYNIASKSAEDTTGGSRFRFGVLQKKDIDQNRFVIRPTAFSTEAEAVFTPGGTASYSPSTLGKSEAPVDEDDSSGILIPGIPPFDNPLDAFIQRSVDKEHDRAIFYVAGLSEHATEGAANYLVSEWHRLYKKYGKDKSFLVVLSISDATVNNWVVVFDKEIETY